MTLCVQLPGVRYCPSHCWICHSISSAAAPGKTKNVNRKGLTVACGWCDPSSAISLFICKETYALHREHFWCFVHCCFYQLQHGIREHVHFCSLQLRHLLVHGSRTCAGTIFRNLEQKISELKCTFSLRLRNQASKEKYYVDHVFKRVIL